MVKDTVKYKNNLILTSLQRDIIVGTLLGDSSLSVIKTKRQTCNIKFDQGYSNVIYIEYLYGIFKDWVSIKPRIRYKNNIAFSIWFKTCRHQSLLFYYHQFYRIEDNKRYKCIPKLIHRWLNSRVLAYWFMDCGSKEKNGYYLHTECYAMYEQRRLVKALGYCFSLQINIHRDRGCYKLYITVVSRDSFTSLIKPYILDCYKYKLHS